MAIHLKTITDTDMKRSRVFKYMVSKKCTFIAFGRQPYPVVG